MNDVLSVCWCESLLVCSLVSHSLLLFMCVVCVWVSVCAGFFSLLFVRIFFWSVFSSHWLLLFRHNCVLYFFFRWRISIGRINAYNSTGIFCVVYYFPSWNIVIVGEIVTLFTLCQLKLTKVFFFIFSRFLLSVIDIQGKQRQKKANNNSRYCRSLLLSSHSLEF